VGVLNRLFEGRLLQPSLTTEEMKAREDAVNDALKCIAIYSNLMNSSSFPGNGFVADACKLPLNKKTLIAAFKTVLKTTKDREMKKYLKKCYVTLANFQPGVGMQDINIGCIEYYTKLHALGNSDEISISKQFRDDYEKTAQLYEIVRNELQQMQHEIDAIS
jgi:hypothetical protein